MSSYILVKAIDGWTQDNEMVYQSGYLVDARPHSRLSGKQIPPNFIQIEITDDNDHQAIQSTYCREWRRDIDWEFVGHNYAIDGHRLRVFIKPEFISVSGLNSLTRVQVEGFLNTWNATVFSVAQNEVVFDAIIFDCLKSEGFWRRDISLVGFTEIAYDSSIGVHRVEASYGASEIALEDPAAIEDYIYQRGGVIIKHPTNKVTFDINRSAVFDVFKMDVKNRLDKSYSIRQFKILPEHIQMAYDNDGTLSITRQQFAQYVYNRLDD